MWTKRKVIEKAFSEIGLASYVFDVTPEEMEDCLQRMDTMLAEWETLGIRLGYNLPADPDGSDEDDPSGLPDTAIRAVYTNLGISIAPTFGKVVSIETKSAARQGFNAVMSKFSVIPEQSLPSTLPIGQGNKWYRGNTAYGPFFRPVRDRLTSGEDAPLDLNSDMQPDIN
jgi:hypothetical protein